MKYDHDITSAARGENVCFFRNYECMSWVRVINAQLQAWLWKKLVNETQKTITVCSLLDGKYYIFPQSPEIEMKSSQNAVELCASSNFRSAHKSRQQIFTLVSALHGQRKSMLQLFTCAKPFQVHPESMQQNIFNLPKRHELGSSKSAAQSEFFPSNLAALEFVRFAILAFFSFIFISVLAINVWYGHFGFVFSALTLVTPFSAIFPASCFARVKLHKFS